jgi:hypothetical protein
MMLYQHSVIQNDINHRVPVLSHYIFARTNLMNCRDIYLTFRLQQVNGKYVITFKIFWGDNEFEQSDLHNLSQQDPF